MDALALLCNLHGDGPGTLAGLREAGVVELSELARLDDERLSELLGGAASAPARFRREAQLLLERLEGPAAGPAEPVVELPDRQVEVVPARAVLPEPAPLPEPSEALADGPGLAPPVQLGPPEEQDPVVSAVLGLWSHLEQGPAFSENSTLAESHLDGLRPEEVVQLAQAGVRTLAELADCDPLVTSGEVGISYTHLSHLRFLARRHLRAGSAVVPRAPAPAGQAELASTQESPAESPAGPFA
jgi:hypothetical protein